MTRLAQSSAKSLDWLAGIDDGGHRAMRLAVKHGQVPLAALVEAQRTARLTGPVPPGAMAEADRFARLTGPPPIEQHGADGLSLSPPSIDGFVLVPMLQVEASAGRGRFAAPDELIGGDMVAFREVWLRSLGLTPGRTHILWAVGDSMNPTISDGDMLLVDRMIDQVIDDGIYVVVVGGGVMVKRIQLRHNGSVVLKSDNERYDEQTIPADEVPTLVVEGRVRWAGGPI